MNNKELQWIVTLIIGGLLFIVSLITAELFAEKIMYGGYIFTATTICGLVLMFIGMKKTMQHIASTM